MGVSGLGWADMYAWARCTGRDPTPTEWRLIRQIDNLFVAAHGDDKPEK